MRARQLTTFSSVLGESPLWDHRHQILRWVDIPQGTIHSLDSGDKATSIQLPDVTGCVALAADDRLIAGCARDVAIVALDGRVDKLVRIAARRTRINDGAVDSRGRMWAGTCPLDGSRRPGALFRVVGGRARRVIDSVAFSNGIGWSPDGTVMYYIDTPTRRVDMFDFESSSGEIHDRRTLASIPEGAGEPDGLTTDTLGNVWVALWGGGQVVVFDRKGAMVDKVELPVTNVTAACFGGPLYDHLYITTARQDPADPSSGGQLHTVVPGVTGARSYVFGSEPDDPGAAGTAR